MEREKFNRIAWWLSQGFVRSYSHDALEVPRIMFSCEGIEFIDLKTAKKNVRRALLIEAEKLRELADLMLIPYDLKN